MKARAAGGVSPGHHTRTMRLSMVGWVTGTATIPVASSRPEHGINGLAPSTEPRKDRSGRREFLLLDPDGNRLAFFAK